MDWHFTSSRHAEALPGPRSNEPFGAYIKRMIWLVLALYGIADAAIASGTICLKAEAWTCAGIGAIDDIEKMDKMRSDMRDRGIEVLNHGEIEKLAAQAQCRSGTIAPLSVTVMAVHDGMAFICNDLAPAGGFQHWYNCRYARAAELSSSDGAPISIDALTRLAAGQTMSSASKLEPCPAH